MDLLREVSLDDDQEEIKGEDIAELLKCLLGKHGGMRQILRTHIHIWV